MLDVGEGPARQNGIAIASALEAVFRRVHDMLESERLGEHGRLLVVLGARERVRDFLEEKDVCFDA